MKDQYIVIAGNLFDGFTHYGVFDSFDEGQEWADSTIGFTLDWWIAKLDNR